MAEVKGEGLAGALRWERGERAEWLALAEHLVDGAVRHMSPNGAHVVLPGAASKHGARSDGMEGFARTLLLHAFRLRGEPASANARHTDRYLEGLHNGLRSTPTAASWLPAQDKGHAIPEAAAIALALGVAPQSLWAPLDQGAKDRLAVWLSACATATPYDNNWRLFGPMIGGFLTSVGVDVPGLPAVRERALSSLAAWERPDGWISDGDAGTFDYYNSFALHYYPLMLAAVFGDEEFAARRASARSFLATLPAFFADDGAPVYFGRSLTYRFGVAASLSAGALAESLPWDASVAREITSRSVAYFLGHGAVAEDGTVRRGWHGEDRSLVQDYSGPAASYWLAKAFANLVLPADHDYWAGAGQVPRRETPLVVAGGLVLTGSRGGSIARLANHASVSRTNVVLREEAEDPLYSRLEYSSASAPLRIEGLRVGSFTVVVRGEPTGPAMAIPTGSGDFWAASHVELRAPRSARLHSRGPGGAESVARRSIRLGTPHPALATLVAGPWFVHVLRLPQGFGWRKKIRWSGLPVPVDSAVQREALPAGVALTGDNLTSVSVGLIGASRRAQVREGPAAPFAARAAFPVVSGRRGLASARWFAVATYIGVEPARAILASVPRAQSTADGLVITYDQVDYIIRERAGLTIERRLDAR